MTNTLDDKIADEAMRHVAIIAMVSAVNLIIAVFFIWLFLDIRLAISLTILTVVIVKTVLMAVVHGHNCTLQGHTLALRNSFAIWSSSSDNRPDAFSIALSEADRQVPYEPGFKVSVSFMKGQLIDVGLVVVAATLGYMLKPMGDIIVGWLG